MSVILGGCGGPGITNQEDIDGVTSAITSTEFQDPSGSIHVRIKTCDPTPTAFSNCAYCLVDNGWARIGGGAEILGESNPGAMLGASFPSREFFTQANQYGCFGPAGTTGNSPPVLGVDDKTAWVVRASGANHQLRAYVIEMQVSDGPNGARVAPPTSESRDNVVAGVNPPVSYSVEYLEQDLSRTPSGLPEYLIGGGAQIFRTDGIGDFDITSATDAFLTESRPVDGPNGRSWTVGARAQHANQPEAMKVYVIGIDPCPAGMAPYCLSYPAITTTVAAATSGYGTVTHTIGSPYLVSAVGGLASASSGGVRYLVDQIPFNGTNRGLTIRSKAGTAGQSGQTTGYGLAIASTIDTYNAIRFLNGTAAFRPTGTNPLLQQSTLFPDAPALHWYLEVLGGGLYRVRNGNPGSSAVAGTECAYRDGNTNNVRVKACGTGNEFKWRFLDPLSTFSFALVNVAANKCLNTNNLGFANGNLVLKTCTPPDSASQFIFQDNFGWPPAP